MLIESLKMAFVSFLIRFTPLLREIKLFTKNKSDALKGKIQTE